MILLEFNIRHDFFIKLFVIEPNLFEEEIESIHDENEHCHNQIEHLEVAPEEYPVAHKRVPFCNILMTMLCFVKVFDSVQINVQFRVLHMSH